jgi:Astacin (Peptidase family M12A)
VDTTDRQDVVNAIAHWNNNSVIQLVPRNGEADFAVFRRHAEACFTRVGRIGGEQGIFCNLGGGFNLASIIHEIGHAVGLQHEHTRCDRDQFVTVHFDNIVPEYQRNFNQHPDSVDVGPYNYGSIMHYGARAFAIDPTKNTIDAPQPIGQATVLSDQDRQSVADYDRRPVFGLAAAVFATNPAANQKSLYLVTREGRLAQVWDTDRWNLDFPAELACQAALRFQGVPAVFTTNAPANKKSIYVLTNDGRLAQIWDTDRWNLLFPAEAAGQAALRFQGFPAVFPTNAPANKKSIYVITGDGRLAQVWDTDRWNLDFPAELAGQGGLRFQGGPAVFPTNSSGNKNAIYLVTTDGRLVQVWDADTWNLDFPAELAGHSGLRFGGSPAVFPTDAGANKKSIYVITRDGRLAQVWDTDRWNLDFPAELAGHGELRFQGTPAVFPTNAPANKKSIYLITVDGRLAQVWDTDGGWNLEFPAELAGQSGLRFQAWAAVFPTDAGGNKKSIFVITIDGRLTQVWDTDRWNLDFPVEYLLLVS